LLRVIEEAKKEEEEKKERLAETMASVSLRLKRHLEGRTIQEGSKRRRASRFLHDRARACVEQDYFCLQPVFDDKQFERIFRITKSMAQQILNVCARTDPFFTDTQDATNRWNIGPMVKVLLGLKMLAYGCSPTAFQDYFQMGEATGRKCLTKMTKIVANDDELKAIYQRKMTRADAICVSELHREQHGVCGMIGSLDCTHVVWKNCPVAWQGQQSGKEKIPTIVMEAMCDYNLWFWHHSFGFPGSMNDINIWDRSSLLKSFLDGSFAQDVDVEFEIGGLSFRRLWLLVDGIYPELSRFVKTIEEPGNPLAASFAKWQEASRKDIERGFGVLKAKFHFLLTRIELWYIGEITDAVDTCMILHNMMVAHRMDNDEEEAADFYLQNPYERQITINDGREQEQEQVDRRMADMEMNRALYNARITNLNHLTKKQEAILESRRFQYVQERWEGLYNKDEHHRLRKAIMEELQKKTT
jgi:Plant transposon protein